MAHNKPVNNWGTKESVVKYNYAIERMKKRDSTIIDR